MVHLPLYSRRYEIITALQRNQVIIVAGETGCGKSTLLPLFCKEAGYAAQGKIAITEPRRIAAIALASYAADLDGSAPGKVIGYTIRYRRQIDETAAIIYMTDGVLLSSLARDPLLERYSVIIIDEAHERTLNIDFLLGYLRILLAKRPGLKLVITSATIDTRLFSLAFSHAPVITVEGRRYDVDIRYHPVVTLWKGYSLDSFIEGVLAAVQEICMSGEQGDILIFLPTVDDVTETIGRLRHMIHEPGLSLLPLHRRLTYDQQREVFFRYPGRKIVVATNIAETSLTVPDIRFVIDSGLVRMLRYEPAASVSRMPVEKISQASADQRAGRCGRVRDGICIRLYSEQDYASRPRFTMPEIKRANCAGFILRMHYLDIVRPASFPFLQRPLAPALNEGYRQLRELGAIDERNRITRRGHAMAQLPLDPPVACMLLSARERGVVGEILVIAAALSATDPLATIQNAGTVSIRAFYHQDSDFMTYLNVWNSMHHSLQKGKHVPYAALREFAEKYGLHHLRLQEWIDAHDHLYRICKDIPGGQASNGHPATYEAIHKCLLAGLVGGIAALRDSGTYEGVSVHDIHVASVSVTAKKRKPWLLFHELAGTDRVYGVNAAQIDPKWVEEMFRNRCTYKYENPWYDADAGVVYVNEEVMYRSLLLIRNRRRECHTVNRKLACEVFAREALAGEKIGDRYRFMAHNHEVKRQILAADQKLRKKYYAGDDALEAFYEEHAGGIATRKELNDFIRIPGNEQSLHVAFENLLIEPFPSDIGEYADECIVASYRLPVQWRHEPGRHDDGATVTIPEQLADMLPCFYWEWQLPVLRKIRTELLVSRLTDRLLALHVDPADAVDAITVECTLPVGHWIESAVHCIEKRYGITVDVNALMQEGFAEHLWIRVVVVNGRGMCVDTFRPGVDKRKVCKRRLWEMPDRDMTIDAAPFPDCLDGNLLSVHEVASPGQKVPCAVWPALQMHGGKMRVCQFTFYGAALQSHAEAIRQALEGRFAEALAWEIETIKISDDMKLRAKSAGIDTDLHALAVRLMLALDLALPDNLPLTVAQYDALAAETQMRIPASATAVVLRLNRYIDQFDRITKLLKKRNGQHAAAYYIPISNALAAEVDRYKKELTDEAVSAACLNAIPQYLELLSARIDSAFAEPARYRRIMEKVAGCRAAIDGAVPCIDYRTACIRDKLRAAVEQYLEGQFYTSSRKRDMITGCDELEAMRVLLEGCYREEDLL